MPLFDSAVSERIIRDRGLDPTKFRISDDGTEIEEIVGTPSNQPSVNTTPLQPKLKPKNSALGTFVKSGLEALPTTVAGSLGAAGTGAVAAGMGLSTTGLGALLGVPLMLGGGYLAAKGAGKVQEMLEPESWRQDVAQAQQEHPWASILGSVAAIPAGGFGPNSINNLSRAAGAVPKLLAGQIPRSSELINLANVGLGAGLPVAQQTVESQLRGEGMPSIGDLALNAATGAIFSKPNAIGRRLGFHDPTVIDDYQLNMLADKILQSEQAKQQQAKIAEVMPSNVQQWSPLGIINAITSAQGLHTVTPGKGKGKAKETYTPFKSAAESAKVFEKVTDTTPVEPRASVEAPLPVAKETRLADIIARLKGTKTEDVSAPMTEAERQALEGLKSAGKSGSLTSEWAGYSEDVGKKRGVKFEEDDTLTKAGQVEVEPGERIKEIVAKLGTKKGVDTPTHELLHVFLNDLRNSKRARDREFVTKYDKLVAASDDYKNWAKARKERNPEFDNSVEEYQATNEGAQSVLNALASEEKYWTTWKKDFTSYLKTRWGKHASKEDFQRMAHYKLLNDPNFVALAKEIGVKVPVSTDTSTPVKSSEESALKDVDAYYAGMFPDAEDAKRYGIPQQKLFTLKQDIDGHPSGSTVAESTLTRKGYKTPETKFFSEESAFKESDSTAVTPAATKRIAETLEYHQQKLDEYYADMADSETPEFVKASIQDAIDYHEDILKTLSTKNIRFNKEVRRIDLKNSEESSLNPEALKDLESIMNRNNKERIPEDNQPANPEPATTQLFHPTHDNVKGIIRMLAEKATKMPSDQVDKTFDNIVQKVDWSTAPALKNILQSDYFDYYDAQAWKDFEKYYNNVYYPSENAAINAEIQTQQLAKSKGVVVPRTIPDKAMEAAKTEADKQVEVKTVAKKAETEDKNKSAAVKIGDNIIAGFNHPDAMNKANKLGIKIGPENTSFGYVTVNGNFKPLEGSAQQLLLKSHFEKPVAEAPLAKIAKAADKPKPIKRTRPERPLVADASDFAEIDNSPNPKAQALVYKTMWQQETNPDRKAVYKQLYDYANDKRRLGLEPIDASDYIQRRYSEKSGFTHERKSFFPFLTSRIDKIAEGIAGSNASDAAKQTAKQVAETMHKMTGEADLLTGRIGNKLIAATKSLKPEQVKKIYKHLHQMDDMGSSTITLYGDERKVANEITEILREPRREQHKLGIMVKDDDKYRKAGIKEEGYMFNMLNPEVAYTWANEPGSKKSNDYDNMFLRHAISKGVAGNEAKEILLDYKKALGNNMPGDVEFGAIRKAEGMGLPWEMVDQNFGSASMRYAKRAAKDIAYFKHIQNNPKMLKALNLKDQFGNRVEDTAHPEIEDISTSKYTKEALRSMFGIDRPLNPRMQAAARAISNTIMGVGTAVRNIANMPAFLMPYVQVSQMHMIPEAVGKLKATRDRAFRNNAIRADFADFDAAGFYQGSPDPVIRLMNRYSEFMRKIQGRNLSDEFEGNYFYSLGELLATDNILKAKQGNTESKRFLQRFGDLVEGGHEELLKRKVTQDDIERIAKRFVDGARGTYNEEGLPSWALEGPIAPFAALSRFSIEKSNTIMKDVIAPLKQGDFAPLVRYSLGSLGVGMLIETLNEALSNKRGQDPTLAEIQATGDEKDLMAKAIGLLQMASFAGVISDYAKVGVDAARGKSLTYTQPLSFPLYSFVSDTLANNVSNAAEAIKSGEDPFEVLGLLAGTIATQSIQTARYIDNNFVRPEDAKRKEKFRDVRVFNELTDQEMPEYANAANPFKDLSIKKFKRSEDMAESLAMLPELIQEAIAKADGNPEELRRQIKKLTINNYNIMPSPENSPREFMAFKEHLTKVFGEEEANTRMMEYLTQRAKNQAKSSMLSSL